MDKFVAFLVTVAVLLFMPLPIALVLSGGELFTSGWAGISKEFWVTYCFGMVTFLASLAWHVWKDSHSTKGKKTQK
ncbi:hypothetical protein ACN08X_07780 [Rothia sp. P6271]|uniref:hypothetical protein n=1 Tax=Rothia sp. P6271 TaxID=3402659 RepID=UPI003AC245B2